jgi:very-short-patch-repair endonuclease
VAISRAREAVTIYSSLMPEQIELSRVRAAGVRDLKHYLEFAIKGPRALIEQSMPTGFAPDSPFETAVIQKLRNQNWEVHPQVGCSGYRIDIGVVDPRARGRYLIGIECDGRTYHSGATARDRDRLRQHVLEGLGWRIHRIWSTDWWLNAEDEMNKILRKLETLIAETEPKADDLHNDAEGLRDEAVESTTVVSRETEKPIDLEAAPPVYTPVRISSRNPDVFYEFRSNSALTEHILQIVEGEGPVSEAVMFRKVARAWGLERTGSRIVERLKTLIPPSISATHEGSQTFYWPKSIPQGSLTYFRIADGDDASKRHIEDVCLNEISAILIHTLKQAGSAPRQDLARSVCRLLGMSATTSSALARVTLAIKRLKANGYLSDVQGAMRLNEDPIGRT